MRRRYKIAFIAERMSVLRGRPPGVASGIKGSSTPHSESVRLLGKPVPVPPVRLAMLVSPHACPTRLGRQPESRNLDGIANLLGQALRRVVSIDLAQDQVSRLMAGSVSREQKDLQRPLGDQHAAWAEHSVETGPVK